MSRKRTKTNDNRILTGLNSGESAASTAAAIGASVRTVERRRTELRRGARPAAATKAPCLNWRAKLNAAELDAAIEEIAAEVRTAFNERLAELVAKVAS